MSEETKVNQEELKEELNQEEASEMEENEMPADDNAEESCEEQTETKEETSEEDEALNTKYLRLMADFQNYKRRAEKEKGDIYAYANEKIIVELLTVMKMIFKQLTDVLEKAGLEEIKAQGEDFNPNFHNAVMTEDNAEYESGKVTEVLQKGYLLNKKVIRPSMVKVNN